MKLNSSSGKVITVFLIIIVILLVSLTALTFFFFQKEIERRKSAEQSLEVSNAKAAKFEEELKEIKKQNFLLDEKNKEADERINSLLDEVELQEGLREELKAEAASLKTQLEKASKEKEDIRAQVQEDLQNAQRNISELEIRLQEEAARYIDLEKLNKDLESKRTELEKKAGQSVPSMNNSSLMDSDNSDGKALTMGIELDQIVVTPEVNSGIPAMSSSENAAEGRVLSVDMETEFLITNLGDKDGVRVGTIMSVYRGNDYLGDVKVSRVQPEMSAADLIPPFSSRSVRKNDQVVVK
jgi:hypothetical protein